MENKEMISKRKTSKLVLLLAVIFLASAVGIGGIYAWKTVSNNNSENDDISNQGVNVGGEAALDENGMPDDGSDITETKTAGDVETFEKLLLENGKFAIQLSEDIRISKGFLVNGTKKLVGNKSITMEHYAEPFQPILKVQAGATLVLDGITLDGNSTATGVQVEKNAGFTSLSGTILYPASYGVLNYGISRIKDIKIERGLDSGLCVMEGSKAYVEGGEISGCSKAAIHVVAEGYVNISGNAKLTDSYMCINNRGVCEITGGVVSDAWRTLVWNLGELTVDYKGKTENDKLEWYNAGEYGIRSATDTKTYISGLYLHDVKKGGIKGVNHEGLVVENCKIENVGTYGVESAKGLQDAVFTNIEVINAKNSAVRVYGEHKIEVTNVTVTDTEGRGIQNGNSTVIAKNIKITNSKLSGIYGGKGSTTEVSDVEIISSQRYGVENIGGKMTVKNAKITDATLSGVYCKKETVTNLSNVDIIRPKKRGIYNRGGTVTADKILVDSPVQYGVTSSSDDKSKGSLTISNLTVRNVAEESGLICNNSVMTAKNVTISDAKKYGARVIGGGTLTITDVNVRDCGMRGIAASDDKSFLSVTDAEVKNTGMSGIMAGPGTTAKLENIYLKNAGLTSGKDTDYTASYRSALGTTDGTIEVKNVTIDDAVGSGVYVNGGTLTAEQVVVNRAGENGAFFTSSKTYGEAVVKMSNVDIQAPENRGVYNDGGTVELSDVKITNPENYGVTTALLKDTKYSGSITIKGLEITGVKQSNALNCNASEMAIVEATISDVAKYGAYVLNGGKMTIEDINLTDCGTRGMYASSNYSVLSVIDAEIKNTGMSGIIVGSGATAKLENIHLKNSGLTSGTDTDYTASYRSALATSDGTIQAKNVTIDDAVGSGVYVNGGTLAAEDVIINRAGENGAFITSSSTNGEAVVKMNGVDIKAPKNRGVYNDGGTVELADVKITNPTNYGVTTALFNTEYAGSVTIKGLDISGVQKKNALNCNASEMTIVDGTISDVAEHGAYVLKNGKLILEDVNISNVAERGVWSEASTATLKNVEVTDAQYGVFVDGGTTTYDGGKVTKASAQGIYITSANQGLATADIEGVTIHEAAKRGVYNYGGNTTLTDVTITDPGEYGVSTGKTDWTVGDDTTTFTGKVTATNLIVTGVKKNNALHCNASEMSVDGGKISDVAKYGVYVVTSGKLTLKDVNISTTGLSGIYAKTNATVGLTNVGINKVGITEDTETTYTALDKSGIGVSGATVIADTLTIADAAEDGVYSAASTTTLKNAEISDAKYGVYVDGGTTTYEGGKIAKVSAQGIYITSANNGLATVNMTSVNIHEAAKRGVHNNGGNVTLTDVTITDPGEYGISSGKASWTVGEETTNFAGKVTATNLTVTGVKKNNALHCNASEIEVTGGTLSNIKEYGARVVGSGKLTLNNVAISQCQKDAIGVQKGTVSVTGGTITGTTGYDVNLSETNGATNVTLTGVTITRAEGNAHGSMIIERLADNDKATTLTLDNCSLTGSGTATTESAIRVNNGTLNIQNGGTYTNNVSKKSGGVIYIDTAGNVNINQGETKNLVSFTNNGCNSGASASSGGVINVQDGGTFKADTCAFTNNYVICTGSGNCMGGVISVGSKTDGNVVIKNATFDGNHIDATKGYGGAISVGGSCYLTMENCVFGQTTANAAANGKDVRGAKDTVINISGKVVAEFYNTTNLYKLHVVGELHNESAIIMKWQDISGIEESNKSVITFATAGLVSSNKDYFALHSDHADVYYLKYSASNKLAKVKLIED